MQDASLRPPSLSDIPNKYTILYVFDPDCGHCREETPKLVSFYDSKKFDVGVYAVCADSSIQKMKSYTKEMKMTWTTVNAHRTYTKWYQDLYDAIATPSLYVLDRNRRIIAKQIAVDKLSDFLTQYEKLDGLRRNK
jgi:thiol-disulfide isomerase/thioredoxin